jgi:Tfp pilus assembly protein PilO
MKKLLILLLIFAALAAFVYYYEIAGKEKRDEAKEKAESLLQIKQENVVSVEVVRAGQPPVILKKSGNEWIVRQPIETPADANTVDSLVRAAASARIERTFEQGAQEAEKYGLKKPRITVKIQAGSDQKVVLLGADDFTGNQVYAQVQGSP